jgi:putative transposase
MKALFLSVVEQAKKKYSFSIRNFCVMSNHIHFMIRPDEHENLSRIMQWILSVFAIRFNRTFGYRGHVWYDRFKSIVIGTLRQFIATFDYITANPIKAGLVLDPLTYRFCGIRRIRDGDLSVVDPPDRLLRLLFPDVATRAITHRNQN